MNRSIFNVILGGFVHRGRHRADRAPGVGDRLVKSGSAEDAAFILKNASSVVIVPGYGMAVAQAQHALREMSDLLKEEGLGTLRDPPGQQYDASAAPPEGILGCLKDPQVTAHAPQLPPRVG